MRGLFITICFVLMIIIFISCTLTAEVSVWNQGGDKMIVNVDGLSMPVSNTKVFTWDIEWKGFPTKEYEVNITASFNGTQKYGGLYQTNLNVYDEDKKLITIVDCPGWY